MDRDKSESAVMWLLERFRDGAYQGALIVRLRCIGYFATQLIGEIVGDVLDFARQLT